MKKYASVIGLECYVFLLTLLPMIGGVRTDEAKYLLNIPYPHPPLARFLMHLTEWMPIQEFFWRIVIATLVVQSAFLVWSMGNRALALLWLLAAPIILQAGTIMMAPITAVQALFFLWFLSHHRVVERYPAFIALFWLASLFTAYQILLFLPVILLVFWRTSLPRWQVLMSVLIPMVLLALYTLTNPLILVSMMNAGTQNDSLSFSTRLMNAGLLWLWGGSVLLSIFGTIGMFRAKRWELVGSLALLLLYVFLSYRPYYAILFEPLFIAGLASMPTIRKYSQILIIGTAIASCVALFLFPPDLSPSIARQTAEVLHDIRGMVLIRGSYGHEWQYELKQPVRKYQESFSSQAAAIVCLDPCEELQDFSVLTEEPIAVYKRK